MNTEEQLTSAQNQLRIKTAAVGGDYAVLDVVRDNGRRRGVTMTGRAFDCTHSVTAVPVSVVSGPQAEHVPPTVETASAPTVEGRLLRLEKLKSDGLISDEEYANKRRAILDEL